MSLKEDKTWKSEKFRQGIRCKLEEALEESGRMPHITSTYVENLIFEDSSTRDEYLNYVTKWILKLRDPPPSATYQPSSSIPNPPDILHQVSPPRNTSPVPNHVNIILQKLVQESKPPQAILETSPHFSVVEDTSFGSTRQEECLDNTVDKIEKNKHKKSWKSYRFRVNMMLKLKSAMERSGVERNITYTDLEKHIFNKSNTKDEYLDGVAKWILRLSGR